MAYLPVTVYIDDVNDHAPQFVDVDTYNVTVDESTPTGFTIFRYENQNKIIREKTLNYIFH